MIQKNVGTIDRTIRVIAGLVILGAGLYLKSWWGLAGLAPLITAFIAWCPAYLPFGLNTCRKGESESRG